MLLVAAGMASAQKRRPARSPGIGMMQLYANGLWSTFTSDVHGVGPTVVVPGLCAGAVFSRAPSAGSMTARLLAGHGAARVPETSCDPTVPGTNICLIEGVDFARNTPALVEFAQHVPAYDPVIVRIGFATGSSISAHDISDLIRDDDASDVRQYRVVGEQLEEQYDGVKTVRLQHYMESGGRRTDYRPDSFLDKVRDAVKKDQFNATVKVQRYRDPADDTRAASRYDFSFFCKESRAHFSIISDFADIAFGALYDLNVRRALRIPTDYFSFRGSNVYAEPCERLAVTA